MSITNNDKSNQLNSNTMGPSFKNYETETALSLNYFNQMLTLSIHLPSGEKKGEYTTFDWKGGVFSYLSAKDCKILAKKGQKAIAKLDNGEDFKPFAIPLKRGVVEFSMAKDLKSKLKSLTADVNDDDICAVIYTDLDENKRTDTYLVHVFNNDVTLSSYVAESGNYTVENGYYEFEQLIEYFAEFSKASSLAYVHVQKHDSRYEKKRWEKMAYELAIGLGVDLSKSSNKPQKQVSSNWDKSTNHISSQTNGNYTAETIIANDEDIDAIIKQMQG